MAEDLGVDDRLVPSDVALLANLTGGRRVDLFNILSRLRDRSPSSPTGNRHRSRPGLGGVIGLVHPSKKINLFDSVAHRWRAFSDVWPAESLAHRCFFGSLRKKDKQSISIPSTPFPSTSRAPPTCDLPHENPFQSLTRATLLWTTTLVSWHPAGVWSLPTRVTIMSRMARSIPSGASSRSRSGHRSGKLSACFLPRP